MKRTRFQKRAVSALSRFGKVTCHHNGWVSLYADPASAQPARTEIKRMGDAAVANTKACWQGFVWLIVRPLYG